MPKSNGWRIEFISLKMEVDIFFVADLLSVFAVDSQTNLQKRIPLFLFRVKKRGWR